MTIRLIGQGIRRGSLFLPIRHLAGRATSTAPPKNYLAQMKAVYDAIVNDWWHYTLDPKGAEVLTIDPERIYAVTLGKGAPGRRGYGDCDDIATASGALLASIGMDVQIATTVAPNSPYIFDHVFIFAKPPRSQKWVCFDPVLVPKMGFGDITKFKRIALWDLNGNLISKRGPFPPRFNAVMSLYGSDQPYIDPSIPTGAEKALTMQTQNPTFHQFPDYADVLGFFGDVSADNSPSERDLYRDDVLPDFARHGIVGYGAYAGIMGTMGGDEVPRIMAEYDRSDEIGNTGFVRTKHFELAPDDYAYIQQYGIPRMGALALADDGEFYQWQSNPEGVGGFFKKLFKKAKKAVGKVAKRVKRRVKKFVSRLPGGKMLWKLGSKLHRTAMKIVKPMLKVIGPIAKKIAPVAALIPGIGPAVSAGLMITGKVYDVAKKYGVKFDSQKRPLIQNKAQGKAFAVALAKAGQKMGKTGAARAIEIFKRRHGIQTPAVAGYAGMGATESNAVFDASIYANPAANVSSRMPTYQGIGWA